MPPEYSARGFRKVQEFPLAPGARRAVDLVVDANAQKWVLKSFDAQSFGGTAEDPAKELELLRACAGPHVVKVQDSYHDGGRLFVVMEHAEGGELASRIQKARSSRQPFGELQVAQWFRQAASALDHVHSCLVLHRDFTSKNLLLNSEDQVRLCDFGVARRLRSSDELAVTVVGTPSYLSPEMCEEQPYTLKSDVWALGCVLFELLALRHPFAEAANLMDMMDKIVARPLPTVPESCSAVLKRLSAALLERDPDRRPTAAAAMKIIGREHLQAQELADQRATSSQMFQPKLSSTQRTRTSGLLSPKAAGSRPPTATLCGQAPPLSRMCSRELRRTPLRLAGESALRVGGLRP